MDINNLNESYENMLKHFLKLDDKIELNICNSIWIRDEVPIKEDFVSVNRETFNALVETLDFDNKDAADRINEWISDATNGKINEMINPPIAPETLMYLINAIYFKGDWTKKFDKSDTFSTKFHAGDGSSQDIIIWSTELRV